mmetsp:Transcript_105742/g.182381  ORF Transcript_105742/g.182381 Transcript_105742/m.182381 type:complete len:120 (-) Transcript_105742:56-415(-)
MSPLHIWTIRAVWGTHWWASSIKYNGSGAGIDRLPQSWQPQWADTPALGIPLEGYQQAVQSQSHVRVLADRDQRGWQWRAGGFWSGFGWSRWRQAISEQQGVQANAFGASTPMERNPAV